MPSYSTETIVSEFHINKLTKAEYLQAVSTGEITTPDISIITDDDGYVEATDVMPEFFVTYLKGADNKTYNFVQVDTVNNRVEWERNNDPFYTVGTSEPTAGAVIWADTSYSEQETTVSTRNTLIGKIYQYIGATTNDFTHGYFYECFYESNDFVWKNIKVQNGTEGRTGTLLAGNTYWVVDPNTGLVSQTITVNGIDSNTNLIVSAAPADIDEWSAANIICYSQGTDTLTFVCSTVPSTNITANILIMG